MSNLFRPRAARILLLGAAVLLGAIGVVLAMAFVDADIAVSNTGLETWLLPLLSALLVFSYMGSYLGTFAVAVAGAAFIAGVLLKGDSTVGAR